MASAPVPHHNRRVGLIAAAMALAMLGLGFAAVPLYRMFCQVTGFQGTTQRADAAKAAAVQVSGRTLSVRFDGNVERGMPWKFGPEQTTETMRVGERKIAFYTAENLTDQPITGRASYNVEPDVAGKYFTKIQCFCFTEQTLQPHQKVEMPVIYYVDPAILNDPDAKDLEQITLSYTFHRYANGAAKGLDQSPAAR